MKKRLNSTTREDIYRTNKAFVRTNGFSLDILCLIILFLLLCPHDSLKASAYLRLFSILWLPVHEDHLFWSTAEKLYGAYTYMLAYLHVIITCNSYVYRYFIF